MKVQVLVDNPNSWMVPYAKELVTKLSAKGTDAIFLQDPERVEAGDILCLLSCEKLFRRLDLNRHNLVVHESELPQGKGWSPLTWQILEGKNEIPITLFEAAEAVDAGDVYARDTLLFNGTELLPELKDAQGRKTIELILDFCLRYPDITAEAQQGTATFYERRRPEDSRLDLEKTLAEQFDLLRVCDNERYPAYFEHRGRRYTLKIEAPDN